MNIIKSNNKFKYYYDYYPKKMPDYLANLTYNIEFFYKKNKNGSSISNVESIFWDDINYLLSDPNKYSILKKWKYRRSFLLTEKEHQNNTTIFGSNYTWRESFILGLLMFEYH